MTDSKKVPTRGEVWRMFRGVDLTPYHEVKNNLTYVPWARAWSTAMDLVGDHLEIKWHGMTDEDGTILDYIKCPGETTAVCCSIVIGGMKYAECTLAVMDYRNKAVVAPTSVDIQNSRQRCQTKALAMLGLGLYLWENDGEFISPKVPEDPKPKKRGRPKKEEVVSKPKATENPKTKTKSNKKTNGELTTEEAQDLLDPPDPREAVATLKAEARRLYDGGWEANGKLLKEIKEAIEQENAKESVRLTKIISIAGNAALKLHNAKEEERDNA